MASLRKASNSPEVTAAPVAPPPEQPPLPPPAPPAEPLGDDTAALALKKQIDALRQNEDWVARQNALALETNRRRQEWLGRNPQAQQHLAELDQLHRAAVRSGLVDGSPHYFEFLEQGLQRLPPPNSGAEHMAEEMQARAAEHAPPRPQPREPQVSRYMSAPVSREVPSANGSRQSDKITLTADQKEAAKMSGISEVEYARQLMRINEARERGEMNDQRG
jgi:hypothetical protein